MSVDAAMLADAATRELSQTSPVLLGLAAMVEDLLAPGTGEWRWREAGPGVGREVRRAMSGLFGRFVARWYAETYLGIPTCVPIDGDDFVLKHPHGDGSYRIRRRPGAEGDLPDWVWAAGTPTVGLPLGGAPAGFLEAKATHYRTGMRSAMQGAAGQLGRMEIQQRVGYRWRRLRTKGWAVGSGWTSEAPPKAGFVAPLLRVDDPEADGDEWTEEAREGFFGAVVRLQVAQALHGLGAVRYARHMLDRIGTPGVPLPLPARLRMGRWKVSGPDDRPRIVLGGIVLPLGGAERSDGWLVGFDTDVLASLVRPYSPDTERRLGVPGAGGYVRVEARRATLVAEGE